MEEMASLWSYQENIDELKQKLLYTTLELEAVKADANEEMKKNTESMKQLLHLLKISCQERDEARDQLQKLLIKIMPFDQSQFDPQLVNANNPIIPNRFVIDQIHHHNQSPLIMPTKANSSITESNSLSEAYNHSSSPVDSLFDPVDSRFDTFDPQKSNINIDQTSIMMESMVKGKTLPQKGNLLRTVLEAGPLLQTLLVAGPLPRWRNPPPLQAVNIPPVAAVDQIGGGRFLKFPAMAMSCGSSSQIMGAGSSGCGGGRGGSGDFGDVNFSNNCQAGMMVASASVTNFVPVVKRQRFQ